MKKFQIYLKVYKFMEWLFSYVTLLNLWSYPSILALLLREDYRRLGIPLMTECIDISQHLRKSLGLNIYQQSKIILMPKILLPNVSNFIILLGPLSWLFALFGYFKRLNNRTLVSNNRNTSTNRKLFFYFSDLHYYKLRKDWKNYWRLCEIILNSYEYQVACLNYTIPDWFKSLTIKEINKIFIILNKINKDRYKYQMEIDYKRVYIPKGINNVRPLGVPTKAWRVYLCMLNHLFTFVRVNIENEQHGYLPNRSTLTAWKSIVANIPKYNFIYEFDFSQFFDSISLNQIDSILKNTYQMPINLRDHVLKLNLSSVKLPKKDEMFEPHRWRKLGVSRNYSQKWNVKWINKVLAIGIPQGAATSPNLATMCLDWVLIKYNNSNILIIMYADDGLIFAQSKKDIDMVLNDLAKICKLNKVKSGYFKYESKFIRPLKFCGLELNPITNYLSAKTRNGSTLIYGIKEQFLIKVESVLRDLRYSQVNKISNVIKVRRSDSSVSWFIIKNLYNFIPTISSFSNISDLFKSSYKGYILSCLYIGSHIFSIYSKNLDWFVGNKFSWMNVRWTIYKRNFSVEFINSLVSSTLKLKCEELFYLLGNPNIYAYLFNSFPTLLSTLQEFKDSGFNLSSSTSLIVFFPNSSSSNYHSELKRLHNNIFLKYLSFSMYCYVDSFLDCKMLNPLLKIPKEIQLFLLKEVVKLSKFNCSSFACNDLVSILNKYGDLRIMFEKEMVKYCYPQNSRIRSGKEFRYSKKQYNLMFNEFNSISNNGNNSKYKELIKFRNILKFRI